MLFLFALFVILLLIYTETVLYLSSKYYTIKLIGRNPDILPTFIRGKKFIYKDNERLTDKLTMVIFLNIFLFSIMFFLALPKIDAFIATATICSPFGNAMTYRRLTDRNQFYIMFHSVVDSLMVSKILALIVTLLMKVALK